MNDEKEINMNKDEKKKKHSLPEVLIKLRRNLFWIIFVFIIVYILLSSLLYGLLDTMIEALQPYLSPDIFYIIAFYTSVILDVLVLFVLTWAIRPNRYLWKSFLPPKRRPVADPAENDILSEFYGRNRNRFKMLGLGLLIGFISNIIPIGCALLHGDIKLYFEASASQIPVFLFALISVFIQSSAEELWCRGFLYIRLHERYPLWVSILVNGILFGAMHIFNDGATVLSIIGIAICGFELSLLRWYTGNIWIAMGVHTGWNFTQAFLFGLPNSGVVSGVSLFHLNASTGTSNLIYDYAFGVEGALPALIIDILIIAIIIVLAAKKGRLKELGMNRPKAMAAVKLSPEVRV